MRSHDHEDPIDSSPRRSRAPRGEAPPAPALLALRRSTALGCAAGFALVTAWAAGATWYVLFRDDIAAQFVRRQSAMQYAYEERVSALRVRLDRMASQKLIEQDGVETRVADLASRQVQLENRQAMLIDLAGAAGEPGPARTRMPEPAPQPASPSSPPKPMPEGFGLRTRAGDGAALASPVRARLVELSGAIDATAEAQGRTLALIRGRAREEATRLRLAIAETGLNVDRLAPAKTTDRTAAEKAASEPAGVGGPLVPLSGFDLDFAETRRALGDLERVRPLARALPLLRPTPTDAGVASPFGYRVDPFTRGPALHTGVDLKAEGGSVARAAGAGTVTAAEWNGGYGNMVEVDHGHGVTTRYAHLSAYAVREGERVAQGQMVGRVGSTGRSTGNHLHYEVRLEGEPVDPTRFLRAAAKLNPTPALAAR
jgi:murein DD-endopeptidase MepM/ murein hydrolase activator NlpD